MIQNYLPQVVWGKDMNKNYMYDSVSLREKILEENHYTERRYLYFYNWIHV